VLFSISQNSLSLKSGQISSYIITVTINKNDEKNIPTYFLVKLTSSNPDNLYPISVYTNKTEYEYTTKNLIPKGASDAFQFKIFGKLPSGATSATYKITAKLFYNNTALENKELVLNVNLHE